MKDQITVAPLQALTTNLTKVRVLEAAIKLNVFDLTSDTHDISDISAKLEIEPDPAERLLNTLVAMELH